MKFLVAVTLVVAAVVTAESPNQRPTFQRQAASPDQYQPRGWRPNGPSFSPTLRLQRQEQVPVPAPSYGPPPSVSYGPPANEPTTTEQPTTTETDIEVTTLEPQAENLSVAGQNIKSAKLEEEPQNKPGPIFVILPQGSRVLYAAPPSEAKSAPLTDRKTPRKTPKDAEEVKETPKPSPVGAVPTLAKIEGPVFLANYEQVPQLIQFQELQAVPVARYASSLSQTSVYTPYSASYVQVFQ